MTEVRRFKLDKIPEGSRLRKYYDKLIKIIEEHKDEFPLFLKEVYLECFEFLEQNLENQAMPQVTVQFVHSTERFKRIEQMESERAISYEEAKAPCYAFMVGNELRARVYIDLESTIDLLKHGTATFIMNLVETYIHEILHTAFLRKPEQEIWDLQCHFVESFLGVKLPDETKKLKASDYYKEKSGNL